MPRHKVSCELPPLRQAFSGHVPYPRNQSRQQLLLADLRAACRRFRKTKPQIFYTMREMAEFFKVPLRTVALIYGELEKEGLLNRLRGSHTLLTGRKSAARFPVRGIVGLPIWLDMLVVSGFTRRFNMDLENRLRDQGYVADMIFHATKDEEVAPDFSDQLLKHNLDVVVWQNPHPNSGQNILSLHEHGVRVILVQTLDAKLELPVVTYLQDWRPGHRALMEEWRSSGVRKVWVAIKPTQLHYAAEVRAFTEILAEGGMDFQLFDPDNEPFPKRLAGANKNLGVAFLDTLTADRLCNRAPIEMERLSRYARIALCRGPLRAPYLQHHGVQLEVVAFSAVEMAEKIAADIQILPSLPAGIRHTFDSRYWPQAEGGDSAALEGV